MVGSSPIDPWATGPAALLAADPPALSTGMLVVFAIVAVALVLSVGADPFVFAIAVTFAASTAFMTPIGYQTNLMVYGPGGYRFTDFVLVGGPLQLLLTVVTVLGIDAIWGVA